MGRLLLALGSPLSASSTSSPWPRISASQDQLRQEDSHGSHAYNDDDDDTSYANDDHDLSSSQFWNESNRSLGPGDWQHKQHQRRTSANRRLRKRGRYNWDGVIGANDDIHADNSTTNNSAKHRQQQQQQQRNDHSVAHSAHFAPEAMSPRASPRPSLSSPMSSPSSVSSPRQLQLQQQSPNGGLSPGQRASSSTRRNSDKSILPPTQTSTTEYRYDRFPLHNTAVVANCPHSEWMAQATVSYYEVQENRTVETIETIECLTPVPKRKSSIAASSSPGRMATSSSSASSSFGPSVATTRCTTAKSTVVAQVIVQIRPIVRPMQQNNSHTHILRDTKHQIVVASKTISTRTYSVESKNADGQREHERNDDSNNANDGDNDDKDDKHDAAALETLPEGNESFRLSTNEHGNSEHRTTSQDEDQQQLYEPRQPQLVFSVDRQRIFLLLFHPCHPASKLVLFQLRRPRKQVPITPPPLGSSRNLGASLSHLGGPDYPSQPIPLPSYLQDLSDAAGTSAASNTFNNSSNNNANGGNALLRSPNGAASAVDTKNQLRNIISPAVATHPQLIEPWGMTHMITAITPLIGMVHPEPTLLLVTEEGQWMWLGCRSAQIMARAKYEIYACGPTDRASMKLSDSATNDGSLTGTSESQTRTPPSSTLSKVSSQASFGSMTATTVSMSPSPPIVRLSATMLPKKLSAITTAASSSPAASPLSHQQGRVLAIDATGKATLLEWHIAPPTLAQSLKAGRRNSTGSSPLPVDGSSSTSAMANTKAILQTTPTKKSSKKKKKKRAARGEGQIAEPAKAASMPAKIDSATAEPQNRPNRFQQFLSRFPGRKDDGNNNSNSNSNGATPAGEKNGKADSANTAKRSSKGRSKSPKRDRRPNAIASAMAGVMSPKPKGKVKSPTRKKSNSSSKKQGKKSSFSHKQRHGWQTSSHAAGMAIRTTMTTTNVDIKEVTLSSKSADDDDNDWYHVVAGTWITPSLIAAVYEPGHVTTGPNQLPCASRVYAIVQRSNTNQGTDDSDTQSGSYESNSACKTLFVRPIVSLEWTQDDLEDLSISTTASQAYRRTAAFDAHYGINYDPITHCLVLRTTYCRQSDGNGNGSEGRFAPVRAIWNWRDHVLGLVVSGAFIKTPRQYQQHNNDGNDDDRISTAPQADPTLYVTSQWMLAWGGQRGRHLVQLDSLQTPEGIFWYQRVHEVGVLSPPNSSVVSLDESISLLMGNSSVFFPMVSRPTCRSATELQWRETALPLPYLQDNGPPRLVAMSMGRQADPDCRRGFSIAVACFRGLAMLTSTLTASYVPRWRLFGSETEERSFRVIAMTWWECDASSMTDHSEDLLVVIIQHCDSHQQFLSCWSAKRLDVAHQLMHPFRRKKSNNNASLSSATEALSRTTSKWGLRLPDDFSATSLSVLAESTSKGQAERRAVAMCSRTDPRTGGLQHLVYNLQVIDTAKTDMMSNNNSNSKLDTSTDQSPFHIVGKAVSKGIISPRQDPSLHSIYGTFLASANFDYDLEHEIEMEASTQSEDEWLVTIGIVYTPGGLKMAVLTKHSVHINVLPVISDQEIGKFWLANVSDAAFTWAIECTDGDLFCWTVPSVDDEEGSTVLPSTLADNLPKGLGSPKMLKSTARVINGVAKTATTTTSTISDSFSFLHGYIHNVGSSSDWMQHSSMGHKSELTLGIAPGSSFGCLLRSGQSTKRLFRSIPDDTFDVEIFAPDFLDFQVLGPSTFIMTPPACIPVLYSQFVEVAHLRATYLQGDRNPAHRKQPKEQQSQQAEQEKEKKGEDGETSKKDNDNDGDDDEDEAMLEREAAEDRIRIIEQRIVHRLNDAPNQDAISMALQLLILRAVELVARAQKKRSKAKSESAAHARLLTKTLFAEIVRVIDERMSGVQIASLFVEVGRQMEPSFLSFLFPLPISSNKLGSNAIEGSRHAISISNSITPQDLFDHALKEKSLIIPAATLPLLSPRVQSRRHCEVLLRYCLESIIENTNPLCDVGFDHTCEERVVIGDIFRFGIKLEDGADWDQLLGNESGSDDSIDENDGDDVSTELRTGVLNESQETPSMRGDANRARSESSLSLQDLQSVGSTNMSNENASTRSAPREGGSLVCFSRSQAYSQSPGMSRHSSRSSVLTCLVPAMFSSSNHMEMPFSDEGTFSSGDLSSDEDSESRSIYGDGDEGGNRAIVAIVGSGGGGAITPSGSNSAEKLEGVAVIVGELLIEQDTSFPEYWRLIAMLCRLLEAPESARQSSSSVQWRELLDRIQLKDMYLLVGRKKEDITMAMTIEVLANLMATGQDTLDINEGLCILDIVSLLLSRLQTNLKQHVVLRSHLAVMALLAAQICGCYTELVLGEDADEDGEEDLSLIEECIEKAVDAISDDESGFVTGSEIDDSEVIDGTEEGGGDDDGSSSGD